MTLEIVYEDLVKSFKVEGEKLFRLLSNESWREVVIKANHRGGYCYLSWNGKMYLAHRIMFCLYNQVNVDSTLVIDHLDGSKTNNSQDNLRLTTQRENLSNRAEHREGRLVGCHFDKAEKKWKSCIYVDKKRIHLGYYSSEIEAHNIYNKALAMFEGGSTIEQIKEALGIRTKERCSSKYRGVSWNKAKKKWAAQITKEGKLIYLGLFDIEEQASLAYQEAK
jgi:hypothetical protein